MASAFNLTAQINLRGPTNLRTVVASMRRQLGSINANVNVNIASGAARSVSSLNTRLTRLNTTLANTRTNVNDVTNAVNALAAAMRGIPNIPPIVPPNLPRAARDLNAVRTEMEEFGRQTGLAIRRFAAFSVGTAGIYGLINAANEGIKSFIAFNKEMTRLQQVTGESQNSLKRVSDEITLLSTTLGVASSDLLNVATTLAQAGLSAKDTEKALKALALSALAPSFDDLNSTVEGSIALMKQFGISAGDLEGALGSINAVAAKFAVEAGDIIAAIQRTGGVFAAASRGVSEGTDALNEFISVFTSVRATTRESAETIATGLRTIFTRIQRASTIEALKDFGITLTDTEGKFVGAYKAVQLLSDGLNRLDPRNLKFSEIVEELGGFRQIGKVIPLIQQFTTAQQALAVAQKGTTSLSEDALTAQLSLANQISKVREEFFALFREIGGSDSFQIMAKATLSLASGLIKLADAAKGVLPIVGTIMAIRGLQGAGQFLTGFRGGIRPRGAVSGGVMRYASGGTVPAMVSNGEAFIPPDKVRQIGVNRLKRMNQADRTKSRKYASGGGIGIFKGPGSGTSDSIGPIDLPVGSFIIREKATKALGFSGGGKIQKFMSGLPVKEEKQLPKVGQRIKDTLQIIGGGGKSKFLDLIRTLPEPKSKQLERIMESVIREGAVGMKASSLLKKEFLEKLRGDAAANFRKQIYTLLEGVEEGARIKEKTKVERSTAQQSLEIKARRPGRRVEVLGMYGESGSKAYMTPDIPGDPKKGTKPKRGVAMEVNYASIDPKLSADISRYIKQQQAEVVFQVAQMIQSATPGLKSQVTRQMAEMASSKTLVASEAGIFEPAIGALNMAVRSKRKGKRGKMGEGLSAYPVESLAADFPSGLEPRLARALTRGKLKGKTPADIKRTTVIRETEDRRSVDNIGKIVESGQARRILEDAQAERRAKRVSRRVRKTTGRNNGGLIQNFVNGDYVEGSALKALKQLTRDFLMPRSRKGGRRSLSFLTQKAVSISKNMPPELFKQIQAEGRLVSGTGIGSLAKGEPGLVVDKIIRMAMDKTKKPRERKINAQTLRNFAKAGIESADPKAAEKMIQSMTAADVQKAFAGSLKRAPAGRVEQLRKQYESDKQFQATISGGSIKAFEDDAKKKIFRRADFIDKIPDLADRIKTFETGLIKKLAQTKDPKEQRSLQQQIQKTSGALRVIKQQGGVPGSTADGTYLSWATRQTTPGAKELANGGEIPIMAQKGEYIINKKSAQAIGYSNLHSLNKYHTGGVIGDTPQKFFMGGGVDRDLVRRLREEGYRGNALRTEYQRRQTRQNTSNSAFALSMALPVINEMIQGNQEPTSAAAASNRAFSGTLATGLGGSLALASMGGTAGPIGAVVVGLGSLVKAFADSENAIREFNIKDSTEILNNQLELTSKSLNEFDKDINNANTRTKALSDVLNSITKAQSVTTESERPMVGVFNLLDEGVGSFERSVVLFDKGISSYLQTLSFFAGGEENARANQAALFAKSIPKIAKERAASFGGVSENIIRLLETEIKKTGNLDALRANDAEFKKLTSSLALADVQVQEQILRVRNNNTLRDEEKENIINGIIARAGENKAIEITNRAMREKAIDELNKAASRASFSLELMFTEMEQSINKSNFAIDKLKESSDLAAASLSGQAKIGQTRLNAINILQNPRAYSSRENMQASSLGASAFGTELEPAIQGLLRFGPILQDTVMSTINQVLTTTPKQELNNEVIAAKISRAVRQSLDRLKLPPELAAKLSNEVGKQIEELRKSGEDKVDFSQLMEKIPALANVVDSAKRAQESAIQALENWQKSLNTYSDAFNRITELQIQNNERSRRSSDILYQGQLELAKAFGEPTNLRGAINNFNATIASMSGGFTTVGDIMQEIQNLERIRQQQQNLQNDAANRGQQGTQAFMAMTDNLKNTNIKLRESYNALEQLSQSSEIAAAAMGRIAELQQKQQAGIGIMEKLVTSTPEELSNFGNALQRLQANMMGRANYGTTAEQRGESLQAFNMIAPLLGGMEGAVKANVLESMLKEANAPLTPFFAQILDSLRNPAADPEMKQAIDIYKASLQQQTLANSALNTLNNQTIKENADFAAKQITIGFRDTLKDFTSRQLDNIAKGISDLVQIFRNRPAAVPAVGKALGGIIYANNGTFVPKGTDTVPAMLTPGEFVVNKQATQKNLPLLKSINNGSKGYSRGGVAYLADGGLVSLYDKANPIGGNDYEKTKKATDKLMASTDKELYDVPMDIRKTLSKSFEEVLAVKPVYYANATSYRPGESRGTGWGRDWRPVKPLELGRDRIDTMAGFGLIADSISADPFNGYTQKPSFLQSSKFSFFLPTLNILDQLSSIKNQQISDIDEFKLDAKLEKYKDLYAYVIESLSKDSRGLSIKYNESSMELGGVKVLSSVNSKPSLKPKVQGFSLNNIADFGKEFLGPFPKLDLSGDSIATKSPLGFATIVGDAGRLKRFYPTAGGSSIGGYSNITGYGTPIGNLIHENGFDIEDLLNRNINKNITDNLSKKIPDVVNRSKESLDQLDSVKIIGSEYALRNEELQKRLYNLYNNQKFSDTFEFPDIAGTDRISLYNIRNQKQWDDILTQIQNTQEGAQPGKNIASTKDWYRLFFDPFGGGGTRSVFLPWTKGFAIDKEILSGAEAQTIAAQNWIKKASTETYKNKNLMFNYNKISGYLFDKEIGSFDVDGGIKDFITIPFGGESLVQNPFAALPQSQQFAYFDNIAQLDAFINQILDETTKNKANDSINLDSIFKTDVEKYGTFNDLIKNNSYLKKDGKIPLNLPLNKFIEAYNKSKRVRELDQGFAVPGAGGVAGDLFDLLKTPKNLLDISSGTVRSPEISRIGGGLGYRLAALKNPDQLGSYVGYLNNLVTLINRDRRAGKVQNYRGGSYTKYNENFVKLYSMIETSRNAFQAIAGNDIGGLSRLIGINAGGLVQNGALTPDSINTIIGAIKNRAAGRAQGILSGGAAQPILSQTTTALDDVLRADREAVEIADIDPNTGKIIGYKPATEQAAEGKTIEQVGKLALNPYNFFKNNTRKSLIDNGIIKAIDNQIRKLRSNKRTPRDLLAKTYGIKNDVGIVRNWFSNIHDRILNVPIDQAMIEAGDIDNLKNQIDEILDPAGNDNAIDSDLSRLASSNFDLSNKALSRLTGGTYALGPSGLPTPLLDFDRMLDLLIERKNLKIKQEAAAVNKATGGVIYASNGTLVNFKPKGTDTVPAMLTPGEFVVNKKATQKNLPLLKSINSGQSSSSNYAVGGVVNSATPTLDRNTINQAVANTINEFGSTLNNIDKNTTATKKTIDKQFKPNKLFSSGGMVYASKGQLIGGKAKGTDTIPAMLTPGEFVVNKKATQNNLGLLKAINRSRGGVVYLQDGGNTELNQSSVGYSIKPEDLVFSRKWTKEELDDLRDFMDQTQKRIPSIGADRRTENQKAQELKMLSRQRQVVPNESFWADPLLPAQLQQPPTRLETEYERDLRIANSYGPDMTPGVNAPFYPNLLAFMNMINDIGEGYATSPKSPSIKLPQGTKSPLLGKKTQDMPVKNPTTIKEDVVTKKAEESLPDMQFSEDELGPMAPLPKSFDVPISNLPVVPKLNDMPSVEKLVDISRAFHGSGSAFTRVDPDKLRDGMLGNGFYVGLDPNEAPINFLRMGLYKWMRQTQYEGATAKLSSEELRKFPGGIYPVEIIGGMKDFVDISQPLSENPSALQKVEKIYAELNLPKEILGPIRYTKDATGKPIVNRDKIPLDIKASNIETIYGNIQQQLAERIEATSSSGLGQALSWSNALDQASRELRLIFVKNGIPGISDLTASKHQGSMAAIFDIDRIRLGQAYIPDDILKEVLAPLMTKGSTYKDIGNGMEILENPAQYAMGGMVYASSGQYINFKPKGSDTVPAMLTPGEFVVNKQATQKNLPLLKSINNGAKGYNKGGVAYLARGGIAEQIQTEGRAQLSNYYASQLAELGDKWFISNDGGMNVLSANARGTRMLFDANKKPIFPATKFLSTIKEGRYALIQALDQAQAKALAQNTPELRNLDWKKEKLIPAKSILQKFINQKEKRNQEFYNFYQRELNLAPDLFESINNKALSNDPAEQTLSDKFKEYIKDPKKLENIRLDLYDRLNWLQLIQDNNGIAFMGLDKESKLPGNIDLALGYTRLKDIVNIQEAAARAEKNAIRSILTDPAVFAGVVTAPPANRFSKGRSFDFQDPVTKNSLQNIVQAKKYANGGIVYASNGQRIKKSSLGSDTVPAMLTPGEFVVNKKAAQQNLPLLQTMNSGGMVYLARGGEAYKTQQENRRRQYEDMMQARRDALAADKLSRQRKAAGNFVIEGNRPTIRSQGPVPVPAAQQQQNINNPQNMNKADDFLTKLGGKIDLFGNYVQKLADLKIPDKIQMNIVAEPIQVVITGSAALESMSEGIQQMVSSQINKKMGQLWGQTEGALGTNPATAQSRNI